MTTVSLLETRRVFLKKTALATATVAAVDLVAVARGAATNVAAARVAEPGQELPWYRRTLRWGQRAAQLVQSGCKKVTIQFLRSLREHLRQLGPWNARVRVVNPM